VSRDLHAPCSSCPILLHYLPNITRSHVDSSLAGLDSMPALDPFSASSRPMLSFDTLPKQPLEFAATLHSIDLNAPRLPKPKRHTDLPSKAYPLPVYSHSRHPSTAPCQDNKDNSQHRHTRRRSIEVGSDEWMSAEVARCVDCANGTLDLKLVAHVVRPKLMQPDLVV